MLTAEKPFPAELLPALPDVIERRVALRYAEAFGLIVVEPAASRDDAVRDLVRGLFGVLAAQLPSKASQMAKASTAALAQRRSG